MARPAPGFMPDDEGMALHGAGLGRRRRPAAGDRLVVRQVGGLPGRRRREAGTVLFCVDHHRGSEENQAGWEHHDPASSTPAPAASTRSLVPAHDRGCRAGGTVVAVVGESTVVAAHWQTRLGMVFIDGGHGAAPATPTTRPGPPSWPPAGCSPSTTCSRTRPTAAARRMRCGAGRWRRARSSPSTTGRLPACPAPVLRGGRGRLLSPSWPPAAAARRDRTITVAGQQVAVAPLVDAHAALCEAAASPDRRPRASFFDRAHEALHTVARALEDVDRAQAAPLLQAKERVESELANRPPTLPDDLRRLADVYRAAWGDLPSRHRPATNEPHALPPSRRRRRRPAPPRRL